MKRATSVTLKKTEREILQAWIRSGKTEQRLVDRAKIVLLAEQNKTNLEIGQELKIRPSTASKWRMRFVRQGIKGLGDKPRGGRPKVYDKNTEQRILEVLDEEPPNGHATWNGGLIAKKLGDVSEHKVWRVLRKYNISLQRSKSWCVSTDPEFARKAADVVGLYLDPPENAVVLCVDEKPHMQALERSQGWLKLPNGQCITGYSHGYKRHGTTTLFAALDITTGMVKAGHYRRRRRREFLDFMNEIVEEYKGSEIHVILDNLNTHKPKEDRWLKQHKNVEFHYTPTSTPWLNQVEIWFSILSRKVVKNGSYVSTEELRNAIDRFIKAYNKDASPFEWTKKKVSSVKLAYSHADLCN